MKQMKLFVWDFDGTLMDTYPFITSCLQKALRDFGHEVPQVEILEKMMVTIGHAIRFYADQFDIPNLKEQYAIYRAQRKDTEIPLFADVDRVLRRVRAIGGENFVFTNRGESVFEMLEMAGIAEEFREIVCSKSEHFVVKPAPDTILYLMEKYGGCAENTVMIGDRVCDLESGYRAGCKTCHLLTPAVPQYPPCDWRIESFTQMLELLAD